MKKSLILAALLPMLGLGLTGCKDDTQPRLEPAPEGSFLLYEPALNNYTYYLDQEGTITLTTNGQPNYGVATPTQYQVQISFIEDTSKWVDQNDPSLFDPEDPTVMTGTPTCYTLQTVNTQSVIAMRSREVAAGMCSMMGIKTDEDEHLFNPAARPVYVRVMAYVNDPANTDPKNPSDKGILEYSKIYSNVVKLNSVQPYFVVPKPAELYIIGDYQGWAIAGNSDTVTLTEDAIGSNVFVGYVEMTAGQANNGFRFYKELGDWGQDNDYPSIGAAGVDGDNKDFALEDGTCEAECVKGKGNFNITNFEGGWMKITVDITAMPGTVTFEAAPDYVPEN